MITEEYFIRIGDVLYSTNPIKVICVKVVYAQMVENDMLEEYILSGFYPDGCVIYKILHSDGACYWCDERTVKQYYFLTRKEAECEFFMKKINGL